MSIFTDYTPDEQQLLLRSVEAPAVAVSAASLGRSAETASEGFAAASYVLESRPEYLSNTLITSIQFAIDQRAKAGGSFPNFVKLASAPGAEDQALETLRQVAALLAQKSTPEESNGFKEWLMHVAVTTSEAGKEGGNIFGWGAVQVNDAERAAILAVAEALGVGKGNS